MVVTREPIAQREREREIRTGKKKWGSNNTCFFALTMWLRLCLGFRSLGLLFFELEEEGNTICLCGARTREEQDDGDWRRRQWDFRSRVPSQIAIPTFIVLFLFLFGFSLVFYVDCGEGREGCFRSIILKKGYFVQQHLGYLFGVFTSL